MASIAGIPVHVIMCSQMLPAAPMILKRDMNAGEAAQ